MNIKSKQSTPEYLVSTDLPYNGYNNLYQAMSVHDDFTNLDAIEIYNAEELALEVV